MTRISDLPTIEDVSRLLAYDAETGIFTWKVQRGRVPAGTRAGCVATLGYRQIAIFNRRYKEHRLAWLLHYGYWPVDEVDHINRISGDNRIANLRECSRSQNQANTKKRGKSSQFKGVCLNRSDGKWMARVTVNYKSIWLGRFATEEDAGAAYESAAAKYHGEFGRAT